MYILCRQNNFRHFSKVFNIYISTINICLVEMPISKLNNKTLKSQFEQLLVIAIINEHYDLAKEICSVEPSRYLLFEEHGISLFDDLERYIDSKTQRIKHITRKYNPESDLSNPLYKDRKFRYK